MATNVGFRSIGIRPGEKLHEVMISEDDARSSVDLGDRYAIKPEYRWWDGPSDNIGGTPVPEGFIYASNQNEDTLTSGQLRTLLEQAGDRKSTRLNSSH